MAGMKALKGAGGGRPGGRKAARWERERPRVREKGEQQYDVMRERVLLATRVKPDDAGAPRGGHGKRLVRGSRRGRVAVGSVTMSGKVFIPEDLWEIDSIHDPDSNVVPSSL